MVGMKSMRGLRLASKACATLFRKARRAAERDTFSPSAGNHKPA